MTPTVSGSTAGPADFPKSGSDRKPPFVPMDPAPSTITAAGSCGCRAWIAAHASSSAAIIGALIGPLGSLLVESAWGAVPELPSGPVSPGLWVPETMHGACELLLRLQQEPGMIRRWR